METADRTRFALGAVRAQRLRSSLTVLGIAVGIATVVLLTAFGQGVREFVLGEFTQFGTNLLGVLPGKNSTFGGSPGTISTTRPLSLADAEAVQRLPLVEGVVPTIQGNANIEYSQRSRRTNIFGVSGQVPRVGSTVVVTGRVGVDVDLARAQLAARICVMRALVLLQRSLGSLDAVKQVLRMNVFVQCADTFTQHSEVADAASDLIVQILGPTAAHARKGKTDHKQVMGVSNANGRFQRFNNAI